MKTVKLIIIFLGILIPIKALFSKEIFSCFPEHQPKNCLYKSQTERYIQFHTKQTIEEALRAHVSLVNKNLFDRIAHHEEPGCIGYHGSTQSFRLYQDCIRFILQDIVQIDIPEGFHFFRIPLDPYFSYIHKNDVPSAEHYDRSLFLWVNYAIYGNHRNMGSCSYYYFTTDGSAAKQNYSKHLRPLFERLEMDGSQIDAIFSSAMKHLERNEGVIFQLFDVSGHMKGRGYYDLADAHCLTGKPILYSDELLAIAPQAFYGEVRMLLSNQTTLNPYSYLKMKRFDRMTASETKSYEEELRAWLRALSFSKEKAERYKQELLDVWNKH